MSEINNRYPILKILLGLILAYVGVFTAFFLADPLVLAPQLDAKENLLWASRIVSGSLPIEPFYRALLYPFLLGYLSPESARPIAGSLLGLICHLANGALVWSIGKKVWSSKSFPVIASVLYLANPASLFFALQLLDVTLGTSLFLGALLLILDPRKQLLAYCGAGTFCGLAILARPHFLPAVLIIPLAAAIITQRNRWRALVIYAPVLALLLLMGMLNIRTSGEFRILPWQGAYNLWAANKPEANGLYFKQSVDLALRGNDENPTRAESIYLYGQTHPEESVPYSIDRMNAFWRSEFIHFVLDNPLQAGRLWLYKAYAVANSFEQYNNLSFPFHKERLPLLRINPINWGILFILGIIGLFQLIRVRPRIAIAVSLIILAYASMLILFYASARFRLPLVPLMAILAGGSFGWLKNLHLERGRLLATIGIIAVTGGLAFSSFGGIRSTATFIQDRLLLANANADLGKDAAAASWAREVLWEAPGRTEAQRIYAISYFNMRLSGNEAYGLFGDWSDQKEWVRPGSTQDPALATILAYYKWHWGDRESAMRIWQQVGSANPENAPLAKLALSVVKTPPAAPSPEQAIIIRLLGEE